MARVAAYDALQVINRKVGSPEEIAYRTDDDDIATTTHSKKSREEKDPTKKIIKSILPKYEIDSTSDSGLKPKQIDGHIKFDEVTFSYPTRPQEHVLKGMTADIAPGKTVAFVGPR